MNQAPDRDTEINFIPNPWELSHPSDILQLNMAAPSTARKREANILVYTTEIHQAVGWLLLTHLGIVLGSFGQSMSTRSLWISWAIFNAEAISKFLRTYIYNRCFKDVPCALVPLHQQYPHFAFGVCAPIGATVMQLMLYVLFAWMLFLENDWEDNNIAPAPPVSTSTTNSVSSSQDHVYQMLVAAFVIISLHLVSGISVVICLIKALSNIRKTNGHDDRLAFVTWWLHRWRHGQLTVTAAALQQEVCGLPSHWFLTPAKLLEHLRASLPGTISRTNDAKHHRRHDMYGSAASMQIMAVRGLLSLCIQRDNALGILGQGNIQPLILDVLREGKTWECKGLAAAIIGVAADTDTAKMSFSSSISSNASSAICQFAELAVSPLKFLILQLCGHDCISSDEVECRERALGALLNSALILGGENRPRRCKLLFKYDQLRDETPLMFLECLERLSKGHGGSTSRRCQTLLISLLAIMADDKPGDVIDFITVDKEKPNLIQSLSILLNQNVRTDAVSLELRAAARGLFWQLAYHSRNEKKKRIFVKSTVEHLVQNLNVTEDDVHLINKTEEVSTSVQKLQIGRTSAGALASFAYKDKISKTMLLENESWDTIANAVRLLGFANIALSSSRTLKTVAACAATETCRLLWILADNNNQVKLDIVACSCAFSNATQRSTSQLLIAIDQIRDLVAYTRNSNSPTPGNIYDDVDDEILQMKTQAVWLVSRLADRSAQNQKAMREVGLISNILALLRPHEWLMTQMADKRYPHIFSFVRRLTQCLGDLADENQANCNKVAADKQVLHCLAKFLRQVLNPVVGDAKLAFFAAKCVRILASKSIQVVDFFKSEFSRIDQLEEIIQAAKGKDNKGLIREAEALLDALR